MTAAKPMDHERLAALRSAVACGRRPQVWAADLLADRDYQELRAVGAERDRDLAANGLAEAREKISRLRARVRVEAEDVDEMAAVLT